MQYTEGLKIIWKFPEVPLAIHFILLILLL